MNEREKAVILIIDDKHANIVALESILERDDRIILSAHSGKDGLTITLAREIDLIILDVQMPEMDGFEVAHILRSNKRTRDIPIIFATAESKNKEFMMKGYEEGAIDYLYKPIDPFIVRTKVNVLLKIQLQKKELREKNISLEKSALLINNSADIMSIINPENFVIEEINPAFVDIVGCPVEEVKNHSLMKFIHEADKSIFRKYAESNEPGFLFESRIYCLNNNFKWLQWKIVSRRGRWFVNARDITEAKRVETIRNYLATIVRQSDNAIYILNDRGEIVSWNSGAETIYGVKEAEILKKHFKRFIPGFLKNEAEKQFISVLSGKKISEYETKRITSNGKLIDVVFSASMISDPDSLNRSVAITERDITRLKEDKLKIGKLNSDLQINIKYLEATNQDLESFSYSVSHDLRAPLRALSGYSKILEEDYGATLDAEANRLLSNIHQNAQKMGKLIDDLLSFSRIGRKEIRRTPVDMEKLVQKTLDELGGYTTHNAKIIIGKLPVAEADYNLLSYVWMNLISNAIKYSSRKEEPVVEIGSFESKGRTVYFVKDNGVGFNMGYANKLFGVFQRLHGPKDFDGTGVGLAIVHRIVTRHGGTVWAEARENEGATFFFTLNEVETLQDIN